jgi:hypothetical protein
LDSEKQMRMALLTEALKKAEDISTVLPTVQMWMNFINKGSEKVVLSAAKETKKPRSKEAIAKAEQRARAKARNAPAERAKINRYKNGGRSYTDEERETIKDFLMENNTPITVKKLQMVSRKCGRSVKALRLAINKNYFPGVESLMNRVVKTNVKKTQTDRKAAIAA